MNYIDKPKVSLIVLVKDNFYYTKLCLESIKQWTNINSVPFELIVVDNGSYCQEEYMQWFKNQECISLKDQYIALEKNCGFSRGMNIGINKAKGDYVVLLNNDIIVTHNWLDKMVRVADDNRSVMIVSPLRIGKKENKLWILENQLVNIDNFPEYDFETSDIEKLKDCCNNFTTIIEKKYSGLFYQEHTMLPFFCVLLKRELLEKVGKLDEDFSYGLCEDTYYCYLTKEFGYKMASCLDSFVYHFMSKTLINLYGNNTEIERQTQINYELMQRKLIKKKFKILIIRLISRGDVLMATRFIRGVRNQYPDAHITFCVHEGCKEMVYGNPYIDNIIYSFNDDIKTKFDIVYDLSPNLIEYTTDWNKMSQDDLYLKRYDIQEEDGSIDWFISESEIEYANNFIKENKLENIKGKIIGVQLHAANAPERCWSDEKWKELIDQLTSEGNIVVILGHKIERGFDGNNIINMLGKTTFREAGAIISKCDLFICIDSGLLHIAQALKIPTIAIFTLVHPLHRLRKQQDWIYIYKNLECQPCYNGNPKTRRCGIELSCSKNINVEDVYKATKLKIDMNTKDVSIIIPFFENENRLKLLLEKIKETVSKEINYEVIVVNDNPNLKINIDLDDKIKLISNSVNLGFGGACNNGARYAVGKFLLFLNDDTIPMKNWITSSLKLFNVDKNIGIVGSKLLYENDTIQHAGMVYKKQNNGFDHIYRYTDSNNEAVNKFMEYPCVTGACLLIKRDLFFRANMFNEIYKRGYFEDTELNLRVKELGYKIIYNPYSVLYHTERGTPIIASSFPANKKIFDTKWKEKVEKLTSGKEYKIIYLCGMYGVGNLGDNAILHGMLTVYPDAIPLCHHRLVTKNSVAIREVLNNPLQYFNDASILVIGGGGILFDRGSVEFYYNLANVAKKLGSKIEIRGVGCEQIDIEDKETKIYLEKLLYISSVIEVRTKRSQKILQNLFERTDIIFSPDYATLINHKDHGNYNVRVKNGIKYIAMALSIRNKKEDKYINKIVDILSYLIANSDYNIILVPHSRHQVSGEENDVITNEIIYNRLGDNKFKNNKQRLFTLDFQEEPESLYGFYNKVDIVIGMRYHSMIFAKQLGKKIFCISRDLKFQSFCEDNNIDYVSIKDSKEEIISKLIKSIEV